MCLKNRPKRWFIISKERNDKRKFVKEMKPLPMYARQKSVIDNKPFYKPLIPATDAATAVPRCLQNRCS